ncbi:MAG: hypothetical protein HYZ49_10725 [Chloroflexi bacterium]|nr:hypothetical protein [Chloroflexota bacterium]
MPDTDPPADTSSSNVTQGGLTTGEGSSITVGQGDVTGRDKNVVNIHAEPGATVIIGGAATAQAGAGLQALGELAGRSSAVRDAIVAFRTEFQEASHQIDVLGDYKDLHDLLHQLEFECYDVLLGAAATFPDDEDDSLIKYHLKLEDIADQLQEVNGRGFVARQDTVWIQRLAVLPADLDRALNTTDKKLLDNVLRRIKQTLDIQPSQINTRLNTTARALRLPALVQALAQVRDNLSAQPDLDSDKVSQFHRGVDALVNISGTLTALIDDHDGWQAVEALLKRIEDMMEADTQELEMSWPDLKTMSAPLCSRRTDKPAIAFLKEAATLEETIASANPDRIRKSFLSYRTRAGQLFYRIDVDLKRLCGELRKVGEPLASVLRMTE